MIVGPGSLNEYHAETKRRYAALRDDQRARVDQTTRSWGYLPYWTSLNARRRAIKKVLNDWP